MIPNLTERVPLDAIDLCDLDRFQHDSQHGAWKTLREEAPVWGQSLPDGGHFWSLTRYRDIRPFLKNVTSYSSQHGTILAVAGGDSAGGRTINLMDNPRHRQIRVPTIRTMSNHVVRERAPRVREHIRDLMQPCYDGEVDFADLMLHIPMVAIGEVLGIPTELWKWIPGWTMAGVAPEDPDYSRGSNGDTLQQAHHHLFGMFSELIAERRKKPSDDLISMLIDLRIDGEPLDDQTILLNCYSFVMGASTTTPHTANHTILALAERPEIWSRLRSDLFAGAPVLQTLLDEGLRWSTPTNHLMRRSTEPVTIGGVDIDAGELIVAWIASANRDEDIFADPYTFDPWRRPNPHIAFGSGPHYCIGGPAARVALIELFDELLTNFESLEVTGEIRHLRSNFINGITRLPLITQRARQLVQEAS